MSYCRWSSEGYQCDLYAYADMAGCWTINVASRRYKEKGPVVSDFLRLEEGSDGVLTWDKTTIKDYTRALKKWHRKQAKKTDFKKFNAIGLAADGESFHIGTLGGFFDKMSELIDMGYQCDLEVLDIIQSEIEQHGRDQRIQPGEGVPEEFQFNEADQ